MNHPYDNLEDPQTYRISRRACVWITVLLMGFILAPPIWRNVGALRDPAQWAPVSGLYDMQDAPSLRRHLREVENRIDDADFSSVPRRWLQGWLTSGLNEGSRRALIGRDGWLYYRPAVEALTGLGPVEPEPVTVMTDPDIPPWTPASEAIAHFAGQLAAHDVELWLVPVPVKPMIVPEHLGPGAPQRGPIRHAHANVFYDGLQEQGVRVIDLTDLFMRLRDDGDDVFLRQDTHWLPSTMTVAASAVAAELRAQPWFEAAETGLDTSLRNRTGSHRGDLAGMIETLRDDRLFPPESAVLQQVLHGDAILDEDPRSDIVLLGDSFVNMFDDPALGFADALDATTESGRIGAGFAQHLAHHLGRRLEVIAINGQGATGVRRELARRGTDHLRNKRAVVWVIAERDLMLAATPARGAHVAWDHVDFADQQVVAEGPLRGEFQLVERSSGIDPNAVPYTEALHTVIYRPIHLEQGDFSGTELLVNEWTFRNRVPQPPAGYRPGARVWLELEPWDEQPSDLRTQQVNDELLRFDLPIYYAVESRRTDLPATTAAADTADTAGVEAAIGRAGRVSQIAWTVGLGGLWLVLLLYGIHRTVQRDQPPPPRAATGATGGATGEA